MRDANAWRIPRSLFPDELFRDRSSPELSRDTVTVDAVKYYLNIYEQLSNRECRAKWTKRTRQRRKVKERPVEDRKRKGTKRKKTRCTRLKKCGACCARAQCFLSGRYDHERCKTLVSTFANWRTGSFDRKYYLLYTEFQSDGTRRFVVCIRSTNDR